MLERLFKLMPLLGAGLLLAMGLAAVASRGNWIAGASPEPTPEAVAAIAEPDLAKNIPAIDLAAPAEFETATFGMG